MRAEGQRIRHRQRALTADLRGAGLLSAAPLEDRAAALGIQIVSDALPASICGYATPIEGQWYIVVAESLSAEQREWTIAHELAHIASGTTAEISADAGTAETLFRSREQAFQASLTSISQSGDWRSGLARAASALTDFLAVRPHLTDPQRQREIDRLAIGLGLVGAFALAALGLAHLVEFLASRHRSARSTAPLFGTPETVP